MLVDLLKETEIHPLKIKEFLDNIRLRAFEGARIVDLKTILENIIRKNNIRKNLYMLKKLPYCRNASTKGGEGWRVFGESNKSRQIYLWSVLYNGGGGRAGYVRCKNILAQKKSYVLHLFKDIYIYIVRSIR